MVPDDQKLDAMHHEAHAMCFIANSVKTEVSVAKARLQSLEPPRGRQENAMAITTLDPKTALIVIDLQKGIVGMPTVHPGDEIVKRAAALAEAFRRHGLPVVLVNVDRGAPGRTEQAQPRRASRRLDGTCPGTQPPAYRSHIDQADLGRVHRHGSQRASQEFSASLRS